MTELKSHDNIQYMFFISTQSQLGIHNSLKLVRNTYEIVKAHIVFSSEGVDIFHFYDQEQVKHILVSVSSLTPYQT